MRKSILRIAGLALVLAALLGVAPARQAAALPGGCACIIDCFAGFKCCILRVNGGCRQTCIPQDQTCGG